MNRDLADAYARIRELEARIDGIEQVFEVMIDAMARLPVKMSIPVENTPG